jgi:hypothetical protein
MPTLPRIQNHCPPCDFVACSPRHRRLGDAQPLPCAAADQAVTPAAMTQRHSGLVPLSVRCLPTSSVIPLLPARVQQNAVSLRKLHTCPTSSRDAISQHSVRLPLLQSYAECTARSYPHASRSLNLVDQDLLRLSIRSRRFASSHQRSQAASRSLHAPAPKVSSVRHRWETATLRRYGPFPSLSCYLRFPLFTRLDRILAHELRSHLCMSLSYIRKQQFTR